MDAKRFVADQALWSVTLSKTELYLLASLLNVPTLMGVDDPFAGPLADQARDELAAANESLRARELLEIAADGSVAPLARLAAAVRANASSERTLLACSTAQDASEHIRLVHIKAGLLVEQESSAAEEISLVETPPDSILQRLRIFFALPSAPPGPGPEVMLPEIHLDEARQLAARGESEACRQLLIRGGASTETASALGAALSEVRAAASLMTLIRSEREMRYGDSMAWLAAGSGAWRVETSDERTRRSVRLIPTDTASIDRRLSAIVSAALQRPVSAQSGMSVSGYE
jgi:hypothetical protein